MSGLRTTVLGAIRIGNHKRCWCSWVQKELELWLLPGLLPDISLYGKHVIPLCWGFYYMPLNATSTETATLSRPGISCGCDSHPGPLTCSSESSLLQGLIQGSEHSLSRTIGINQGFCTKKIVFCFFNLWIWSYNGTKARIAATMWLRWEENSSIRKLTLRDIISAKRWRVWFLWHLETLCQTVPNSGPHLGLPHHMSQEISFFLKLVRFSLKSGSTTEAPTDSELTEGESQLRGNSWQLLGTWKGPPGWWPGVCFVGTKQA